MFKIDTQTKREMCIEVNVCIQNKELHRKTFTHKFFSLLHPYQSNDNVNTKQTLFKQRASDFSFVKNFFVSLTIENILCNVEFCKHVLCLNGI